ncbi:MAG: 30S ribosomal protein S20, partial [Acidimicrobiales bacterium]
MANIKSQIKRNRQTIVRTERNKAVRSELKTRTKNAVKAVEEGAENAADLARAAQKRID